MTRQQEISELARAYFGAYVTKQRNTLEAILRDDFTFRCPLGSQVDRAAYFEHCWPGSAKIREVNFETLLTDGDEAMVRYEATLVTGATYRCAEYLRAQDGQLVEVMAYFGNHPDHVFSIFEAAA